MTHGSFIPEVSSSSDSDVSPEPSSLCAMAMKVGAGKGQRLGRRGDSGAQRFFVSKDPHARKNGTAMTGRRR